jgi:L-cystine transport system permease protein
MFSFKQLLEAFPQLLKALPVSLEILAGALFFGIIIAFIIAWIRLNKIKILSQICVVYVSFIRGTPTLIQLFLVYYGVPAVFLLLGLDITRAPVMIFVILTYALQAGGFMSEIIRSAVNSIDKGQSEAALAVGMTPFQSFTRIVLPQAMVVAIPNFGNTVVSSLKETSLAFSLGIIDMMGMVNVIGTRTFHYLEIYIDLAIIYYIVCFLIEKLFVRVERKLQSYGGKSPVRQETT